MGKNDAPDTPEKPNAVYKIGDRTAATAYWDGNNYNVQYAPSPQQQAIENYLGGATLQAYKDAGNDQTWQDYKQNWLNNQTNQYNKIANQGLSDLKDGLITGGQVNSSTGWNKIKSFADSYNDTLADISANADINALNYRNGLLNYANSLNNALTGYYNLDNYGANLAAGLQNNAWNQNVQDYQNQLAAWQAQNQRNSSTLGNIIGAGQIVGSLALAPFTGGTSLLGAVAPAASLASKTGA